jgi:hypothetical protein
MKVSGAVTAHTYISIMIPLSESQGVFYMYIRDYGSDPLGRCRLQPYYMRAGKEAQTLS